MEKLLEAIFGLLTILVKGIFNVLQVIFGQDPEFRKGKYSATFMSLWDRIRLVSSWNKGVTLGTKRLKQSKGLEHVLVCGGSGSGKTSSVVIPSILNSNSSFICTDVDGSIYQKVSGDLKKRGYSLQVLNLADISRSVFYNPLAYCHTDSDYKQLTEQLIETAYPKNSNSENTYWSFGAQTILYIFLRILKTQDEEYRNLANLRYLLQRYAQLDEFVMANASADVWNDWLGFVSAEEKIQSGMVSSALVALDKLSDSGISFITSKNTLDFSKLTKGKKSAIFIQVPEAKLSFYSFLLSIMYVQFFQYIQLHRPKKIVYAYLDEFPALRISDFPLYAVTARRYNLTLVALIQSESQLIENYGHSGYETLFNGSFAHKLIIGAMSLNLARQLSQSFGRKGVAIQPQTKPYLSDRELMTVQELVQLDMKKAVYLYRGKPPYIMNIKPYFKQFSLRRKSNLKPVLLEQHSISTPLLLDLTQNPLTTLLNDEE